MKLFYMESLQILFSQLIFYSTSSGVLRVKSYSAHSSEAQWKGNLNKEISSFPMNFCLTAKISLCQHMKVSMIRPQSSKIPINYDDQICLHQQSINKSCSALCSQLSWKILLEGCENSLINYKCSATYHTLHFEMLNIHIHTCYICVEVFLKLFQCFFMLLSTEMLSRIKMEVC